MPLSSVREGEEEPSPLSPEPGTVFRTSVAELQSRAREQLLQARETAGSRMVDILNTRRKQHSNNILRLLGLSIESKVRTSLPGTDLTFSEIFKKKYFNLKNHRVGKCIIL